MEPKTTKKPSRKLVVFKRELPFYLMLIPGVTFLIIFSYLPMFGHGVPGFYPPAQLQKFSLGGIKELP